MAVLALCLLVFGYFFKYVYGDCNSITASLMEEVLSLKQQISDDKVSFQTQISDDKISFQSQLSALQLQFELDIQELQLTSSSCSCDGSESITSYVN